MRVDWILLVEDVVELFCVLAEFLSRYSVDRWERAAEVSNYSCGFLLSDQPVLCYLFCSVVVVHRRLGLPCTLAGVTLVELYNIPSVFSDVICSEVYLS